MMSHISAVEAKVCVTGNVMSVTLLAMLSVLGSVISASLNETHKALF